MAQGTRLRTEREASRHPPSLLYTVYCTKSRSGSGCVGKSSACWPRGARHTARSVWNGSEALHIAVETRPMLSVVQSRRNKPYAEIAKSLAWRSTISSLRDELCTGRWQRWATGSTLETLLCGRSDLPLQRARQQRSINIPLSPPSARKIPSSKGSLFAHATSPGNVHLPKRNLRDNIICHAAL